MMQITQRCRLYSEVVIVCEQTAKIEKASQHQINTVEKVQKKVLASGAMAERKNRLTQAGYNYSEVQARVITY